MSDSVAVPIPSPVPDASQNIKIDSANVVHDADRDARHGLSHLEGWFLGEVHKIGDYLGANVDELKSEMKRLLSELASKL